MRFHPRRALTALLWLFGVLACAFVFQQQVRSVKSDSSAQSFLPSDVDDPVWFRRHKLDRIGPFRRGGCSGGGSTFRTALWNSGTSTPPHRWNLYAQYRSTGTCVWPVDGEKDDRILNQIHLGSGRTVIRASGGAATDGDGGDGGGSRRRTSTRLKKIFLIDRTDRPGQSRFIEDRCPVNRCTLTDKLIDARNADAVLFKDSIRILPFPRPESQIWILFQLESPFHSSSYAKFDGVVNWTATYRTDSTIVAPYEKFATFDNFTGKLPDRPPRNYASGKTKLVAWFVSNCKAPNGRNEFVRELQKHIAVDVYGTCGQLKCPRVAGTNCFDKLARDYKFYMSFENSNCRDYITEKLYWNALNASVVPIVMGAHPDDYKLLAPPGSYIHVDDFESPASLAKHLLQLDANDELYNRYFRWVGIGEFIDTKFWCRLCAMIHDAHSTGRRTSVGRLETWWRGPGVCVMPRDGSRWSTWRTSTTTTTSNTTTNDVS